MAVPITVTLTDEQVTQARNVLPDGTTAAEAKTILEAEAAEAIAAKVWEWTVADLREQANDVRKTRREAFEALFPAQAQGDPPA